MIQPNPQLYSFWEIKILSEKLTTTTMDKSPLKKRKGYWSVSEIGPSPP